MSNCLVGFRSNLDAEIAGIEKPRPNNEAIEANLVAESRAVEKQYNVDAKENSAEVEPQCA